MGRTAAIKLRRWQQEALLRFESSGQSSFLAVATPGAGKTAFALAACVRALRAGQVRRVIVVAPTQHLKQQWADAALGLGLRLEPEWGKHEGALPSDHHGAVLTYQQLAASPAAAEPLARDAFAVLDEIHHAADSRAWGEAVRTALGAARVRLCLSGTPFRSDQNPIPFIRYQDSRAQPDYEYGYARALAERGVVRPVYFPRIGGHMEWTAPDGTEHAHGFEDRIGAVLAGQRLRTALSSEHEWLPAALSQAHAKLLELRREDPCAGAMAIAMDQAHARAMAELLREQLGVRAALATSDDPEASAKISAFSRSDAPWLVAVRMVSEGVDIPRLRVGVYATNTVTELFFRQAVGRLVRATGAPGSDAAYMFIPDDARLRGFAASIQQERRHSLRPREADENSEFGPPREPAPPLPAGEAPAEQLSLFSALSAVPTATVLPEPAAAETPALDSPAPAAATEGAGALPAEIEPLLLEPLPPSAAPAELGAELEIAPLGAPGAQAAPSRRSLREQNAERAQLLARRTGMTHAAVNAELNRQVGLRRITEASALQLQKRLQRADAWLKQLRS